MTLAVKSLSSLCLMVGRPPVGQLRARLMEKAFHKFNVWVGYLPVVPHAYGVMKCSLVESKLRSSMGNAESHNSSRRPLFCFQAP